MAIVVYVKIGDLKTKVCCCCCCRRHRRRRCHRHRYCCRGWYTTASTLLLLIDTSSSILFFVFFFIFNIIIIVIDAVQCDNWSIVCPFTIYAYIYMNDITEQVSGSAHFLSKREQYIRSVEFIHTIYTYIYIYTGV